MNEKLPNQQETQNWQNKLEIHKNAAPLNASETKIVLGSALMKDRADFDQTYEADTIVDSQYEDSVRKIDGAMKELSNLQAFDEDSQNDFNQDLQYLASSLKQEHEKLTFGTTDFRELAERRASVKYLIDQFDTEITMPQEEIKNGTKPSETREAIKDWTNQAIEAHNNRIDGNKPESIADSPEMRQAKERINSRYADQLDEPVPTETIGDARQKVAEAYGDKKEKEQRPIIGEVARAAKGVTRIHTDIPNDIMLKSNSGDYRPIDGFNSFGDGLPQESRHVNEKLRYGGSAEAFLFEPDTTTRYKTVTETVETGGFFRKKTEKIEKQVSDGETPTMIVNPATGKQEIGIKVAYQFNGNTRRNGLQTEYYEGPDYVTENGRTGNQLFVEATLPKSVADKLKQEISSDPEIAREFAKTLALNNGITEQVWNNVVRPPFDQVPAGWEMTVAELQKDTQYNDVRHNVVNQQSVKVK